jgi:hypothetical protein
MELLQQGASCEDPRGTTVPFYEQGMGYQRRSIVFAKRLQQAFDRPPA